jgi:hypothetical protein
VVVDDHDLKRRRAQPGKVSLDDLACLDGLTRRVLPASTGQSVFDPDREEAEGSDDDEPDKEDGPKVSGRPSTEPSQGTGIPHGRRCARLDPAAMHERGICADLRFSVSLPFVQL